MVSARWFRERACPASIPKVADPSATISATARIVGMEHCIKTSTRPVFNVHVMARAGCLGLPRFNNSCEVTVPRYQARVLVRLRPSVLDPAGEATRGAAERLGVEGISKLRIGKAVELEVEAPDAEEARRRLEVLSDRLLANPVIEDWSLELQDS